MVDRVLITDAAAAMVDKLKGQHGPLMFHQSGGCCDGSAPMCFPAGEFKVGGQDVLIGEIAGSPFYIGAAQFEYWRHTQLIIDVVPGRGAGFSVEGAGGGPLPHPKPRLHRRGVGGARSGGRSTAGWPRLISKLRATRDRGITRTS